GLLVGAPGLRDRLAVHELAQQHRSVLQGELHQGAWPEEAQAVHEDHGDQPGDHQERRSERAAGEPDVVIAALERGLEGHQRALYFSRSRWRISSARVLTRNVIRNSTPPARNNTRYSVPPKGASGTSTAMFAERVRMPLKMDQSRTGVFPVAIRTIIVSPTA